MKIIAVDGVPCNPDEDEEEAAPFPIVNEEQNFYTDGGDLALTICFDNNNKEAHVKINKKLLMKFNLCNIVRVRKWMSSIDKMIEEYEITNIS